MKEGKLSASLHFLLLLVRRNSVTRSIRLLYHMSPAVIDCIPESYEPPETLPSLSRFLPGIWSHGTGGQRCPKGNVLTPEKALVPALPTSVR